MRAVITLMLSLSAASITPADEPEKLPPPKVILPGGGGNMFLPAPSGTVFVPSPPPIAFQHGTRDVWQNFAVDGTGHWRHRVILAPYGSYYHQNGQPYPWTTLNPRFVRPYALD